MIVKVAVPQRFQFKMAAGFGDIFFPQPGDSHYIGGTEVLPPPLEAEEESELLSAFGKEGDSKAKRKLIEHNLRLVVY
ncbi:MAG: RNA polymerase sporulation sigma factor SigE, partial [Lachnospiraceae bacterium]|nr:RNA polymerase sporulation sigma factor SigE [Lachnospiraceae bacterium]